jgi:C-terminal processing protease CtpA/Prc
VVRIPDFAGSRMLCSPGHGCAPIGAAQYAREFNELAAQGAQLLILDLRGNQGGYLEFGESLVEAFGGLRRNSFGYEVNSDGPYWNYLMAHLEQAPAEDRPLWEQQRQAFLRNRELSRSSGERVTSIVGYDRLMIAGRDAFARRPVVVLIDPLTGSTSEIVAEQLRREIGAVVVGRPSIGAVAAAESLPYTLWTGLKLMTAQATIVFSSPEGQPYTLQGVGVTPDFAVPSTATAEFWGALSALSDDIAALGEQRRAAASGPM